MATWTGSLVRLTTLSASLLASGLAMADARIDPLLNKLMVKAKATDQMHVVVSFKQKGPVTPTQLAALKTLGITKGTTMRSLPIMGAYATPARIKALAKRSDVVSIYYNAPLKYYNMEARQISGSARVYEQPSLMRRAIPYTGKGITVMVNDSGIDTTNPDLPMGTKVVDNVQAVQNSTGSDGITPILHIKNQVNTDLGSGHGTHCAGTVGGTGQGSGGKLRGAAPGADILGYGSGGVLLILDAVGGLDYALTNQFAYRTPVRVVSNSWGSSGPFDPTNPVNISTLALYNSGIVSVFAAGNDGPGEDTHNPYAQAPWVISVGAGEKDGVLTSFSSRGKRKEKGDFTMPDGSQWTYYNEPTIVASGVNIVSTRALTGALPATAAQEDQAGIPAAQLPYYTIMSGTSMATPHVAGVIAQMLEANPNLSPKDVKEIIKKTATNMSGRDTWEVGAGHLNAYAAVAMSAGLRKDYGTTTNAAVDSGSPRAWNAKEILAETNQPSEQVDVSFTPVKGTSTSATVIPKDGVIQISAKVTSLESTIAVVLTEPEGTPGRKSYGSAIATPVLGDTVSVSAPVTDVTRNKPWTVSVRGIGSVSGQSVDPLKQTDGIAAPTFLTVDVSYLNGGGFDGLDDIKNNARRTVIETAITKRLMDARSANNFAAGENLTRAEFANYLVMGANIRQHLPFTATSRSAADVAPESPLYPVVESVLASGGVLRDLTYRMPGVMSLKLNAATGKREFMPNATVSTLELAQSLVKALGPVAYNKVLTHSATGFTYTYVPNPAAPTVTATATITLTGKADLIVSNIDRGYIQSAIDNRILPVTLSGDGKTGTVTIKEAINRGDYAESIVGYNTAYRTGEDGK